MSLKPVPLPDGRVYFDSPRVRAPRLSFLLMMKELVDDYWHLHRGKAKVPGKCGEVNAFAPDEGLFAEAARRFDELPKLSTEKEAC